MVKMEIMIERMSHVLWYRCFRMVSKTFDDVCILVYIMLFLGAAINHRLVQLTSTVSMHSLGQGLESKRQSLHLCLKHPMFFFLYIFSSSLVILSLSKRSIYSDAQSTFYAIDPFVWLFFLNMKKKICSLNKDDNLVCCLFSRLVHFHSCSF